MSVPEQPALPPPVKVPRRWRRLRRISLRILIALLIITPIFYAVENYRGRKSLEASVAAYEATGESLNPADFLTKAPPPAENFAATPLLDGIMTSENAEMPMAAIMNRKRQRLERLRSDRFEGRVNGAFFFWEPSGKSRSQLEKERAAGKQVEDKTAANTINWFEVRQHLHYHGEYKPPPGEPSDVRAVDFALDHERALFDELITAAERPSSVFTPAPAERSRTSDEESNPFAGIANTAQFMRLRVLSAATLGRHQEAAALTKIFWKLREASLAEPGGGAYYTAGTYGGYWAACARETMRSPGADDATLLTLQRQIPASWSPERELLSSFRGDAARSHAFWKRIISTAEWSVTGDLYGAFEYRYYSRTRMALLCPSGWLSQNAAEHLRRERVFSILPLRKLDFSVLPAAEEALNKEDAAELWMSPYSIHLRSGGNFCTMELAVIYPMRIRLMLLALGMERYRLKHGIYTAESAALVPDCIASVPLDIDGNPLRIATAADGSRSVLYSIGWNLTDDWDGLLPAGTREHEWNLADWPLSLPFPPLPPP